MRAVGGWVGGGAAPLDRPRPGRMLATLRRRPLLLAGRPPPPQTWRRERERERERRAFMLAAPGERRGETGRAPGGPQIRAHLTSPHQDVGNHQAPPATPSLGTNQLELYCLLVTASSIPTDNASDQLNNNENSVKTFCLKLQISQ